MAIRHEDIAVGRNGHSGRSVKRIWPIPSRACLADSHEHLTSGTYFKDLITHRDTLRVLGEHAEDRLVIIRISRPQIPVFIDCESVWMSEQSDAETLEKPARRTEFQNRRIGIASIEAR